MDLDDRGTRIILQGETQVFRDQPDLRVKRVIPLEKAHEELARRLVLKLGTNGNGNGNGRASGAKSPEASSRRAVEQKINRLRRILRDHRGACQVLIDFPLDEANRALVVAGQDFRVTPNESFRQRIEELLGEGAIKFTA